MEKENMTNKERFIELLRSTGRNGVEELIEDLEHMGFFEAPASASHHLNTEGGLVEHSLNTCRAALAVWEGMKKVEPSLETEVKRESIIIASLLHDVCKADMYMRTTRRRKTKIGDWEDSEGYRMTFKREVACPRIVQRTGDERRRDARDKMAHGSMGSEYEQL